MEFGGSGDALLACRRRGIVVWSSGAREALRAFRCGGMELGSSEVVLQVCRRRGMELGSSGGALQA